MLKGILRGLRSAWRSAMQRLWFLVGKKYRAENHGREGLAVAILVDKPWGYKLSELIERFADAELVTFVTWGPFKFSNALTKHGRWLHSRANSWGSAANFAMNKLNARKVLVVGQEFDIDSADLLALSKLPVGCSPVILDSNGLVVSAGLARAQIGGQFEHVLRGFNVADLPTGSAKGLPGVRIVLAGADSLFGVADGDASSLGVGTISFDIRVRMFKNYPLPARQVSIRASDFVGDLLGPKLGKQRWAIKNPAWGNRRGDNWGDTFFVNDLAEALREQGVQVADDRLQNWYRPTRRFDDVELVIRGKEAYRPSGEAKSVLWVISHPELVAVEEIGWYDLVFAASATWAAKMSSQTGKQVRVLYQATNPERFKVMPPTRELQSEVLFVGRTREVYREVVEFAVRAKAKLSVYGEGWQKYIDKRFIKSDFLANEKVPAAYASSSIVLNDHWNDMREAGFISNRVFDAAACGARVLSDHIEGMPELFGGLVQTYHDFDSFQTLVSSTGAWPTDAARKKLAGKVAAEHSFEARAKELIAAVRVS